MAEPIETNIFEATYMTPEKVYGSMKLKCRNFIFLEVPKKQKIRENRTIKNGNF